MKGFWGFTNKTSSVLAAGVLMVLCVWGAIHKAHSETKSLPKLHRATPASMLYL